MGYALIVVLLIIIGLQVLKAASQISSDQAKTHIQQGAVLLDVRTDAEFRERSIPGVTNLPLDRFEAELPKLVPDKGKPLLLHCRSGNRSGIAEKIARNLGYTNVHNLGSFDRARRIIGESSQVSPASVKR